MNIALPTWMIKRLEELYPHLSSQAAIKHYLRANLNDVDNKHNKRD